MTPGEFEDYLSGAFDAERDQLYAMATISSFIARTMGGQKVSPGVLLGEEAEGDDEPDPLEVRRRFLEDARRRTEARQQAEIEAWLPDGIEID